MGDLIERQAALEGLANIAKAKAKSDAQKSMIGRTMFFVEQLPSVSTEKTGYWHLLDECSNSGYYCSECHKKVVKEGWSETVKKIKFCPNCGAKMEVEE